MPMTDSYQIINQNYNSNLLLLCDHATNWIPKTISERTLGLSNFDLSRHIAYDIGAKETASLISKNLNATMICSNFSRLVIDPNRSEKDPTLIMQLYDGTVITENIALSKSQIAFRKEQFYHPYHNAINKFISNHKKLGGFLCIVSIHSFNSKIRSGGKRPWHIGVLWDKDTRLSQLFIEVLSRDSNLCIGENKPYSGSLPGDTLNKHATSKNIPHVLIEIRNDLISSKSDQLKWAGKLSHILRTCINNLLIKEPSDEKLRN